MDAHDGGTNDTDFFIAAQPKKFAEIFG
jgi:hypothetical protein